MREKHSTFYELKEALERKECPLCFLTWRSAYRFLENLLYEKVNDPGVRSMLRKSRGFCGLHALQVQEIGGALGIAIIYKDLTADLVSDLLAVKKKIRRFSVKEAVRTINNKILKLERCPACKVMSESEKRYFQALFNHLEDPELNWRRRESDGLCLPHFVRALELADNEKEIMALLDVQIERLRSLENELVELIRKHNYRYSQEALGAEYDSWIRVLDRFVGKRSLSTREKEEFK